MMLIGGPGGRSRTKIGGKALLPSDKALFMDMLHNLNNTRSNDYTDHDHDHDDDVLYIVFV